MVWENVQTLFCPNYDLFSWIHRTSEKAFSLPHLYTEILLQQTTYFYLTKQIYNKKKPYSNKQNKNTHLFWNEIEWQMNSIRKHCKCTIKNMRKPKMHAIFYYTEPYANAKCSKSSANVLCSPRLVRLAAPQRIWRQFCQLFGTVAIIIRHHDSILVWIRTPLVHKENFGLFRWWSSSLNISFITSQIWINFIKMASMPELGSKISLISKADIRYEGQLFTVDPNECTIALANGK